ncbi:MAG: hypothetical protein H6765_02275 [Candidatus Peribacteria bacterium]|nr:MAG: hypothetical protein H6765_02275 [Candidatus Peribacteria bacterium]
MNTSGDTYKNTTSPDISEAAEQQQRLQEKSHAYEAAANAESKQAIAAFDLE